jgi:drug/metabolite transporter (DMT)-like permease
MDGNPAGDDGNPVAGIGLKIASVFAFVGMQTCIKAAGQLPAGQIVFFRSLFAIFPIIAVLAYRNQIRTAFSTERPWSHVLRGTVGVTAMSLGFFGLTRLPLPEAVILNYANPLIVVVFGAIFLKETVRLYRWSAVAIGFVGVLIISWPKLTLVSGAGLFGAEEALGVLAVLGAAAVGAVAMLLVRRLVNTETTSTIVMWFSMTATVLSLATIPFGWDPLTAWQAAFLIAAGICGGLGQMLLTQSYRHADVSTIAPFEYSSMLIAIVVGYYAFGNVPTGETIIGGAIVVAAGIFIILREQRLGLERARARKAATPQG